jgi:hypothetical protein
MFETHGFGTVEFVARKAERPSSGLDEAIEAGRASPWEQEQAEKCLNLSTFQCVPP